MGNLNCKGCDCTHLLGKHELDLKSYVSCKQDITYEQKSDDQTPETSPRVFEGKPGIESLKPHIPKLEALWMGYQARKQVLHYKRQVKSNHNYFSLQEIKETLSSKARMPKLRSKRKPYKYSSGAVYRGEWCGGFRDGKGVMEWPDGAKYEGHWSYGRPRGTGRFVHVDGDVYEGEWKKCFIAPRDTFGSAGNLNKWKDLASDGFRKL